MKLDKILNRIKTKPGYKIITAIAVLYVSFNFYENNIMVTALVDNDGYVYATKTGNNEPKYITPVRLSNSNAINFDTWKYDSEN
jgi:hypothetical protein